MTGQKYDNNHNLGKCPEKKQKQTNKQKQTKAGPRRLALAQP